MKKLDNLIHSYLYIHNINAILKENNYISNYQFINNDFFPYQPNIFIFFIFKIEYLLINHKSIYRDGISSARTEF
jgi:hypothetical protein